jgi:DHA1 family multidrug resistance protein-like MFS transporter
MIPWKKNLATAWIAQIFSLTGFGFVLPFLPYYIQELGITSQEELHFWVGLISAAPSLLMGLMAPVWGILSDKLGRKLMMLRAMAGGAIILALIGLARNVQTVFILRLAQGLFTGTITASATLVASGTPRQRLSFALGFLSSSTFIGFSIGPFIGGLLAEFIGYKITFFIGGGIVFSGFMLVLLFIRESKTTPAADKKEKSSFSLENLLKPPFIYIFLCLFLLRFARALPVPFLPLYIQQVRGTLTGAAAITGLISSFLGIATALAGLTLARLGDKHNKSNLLAIFLASGAMISFPIFFTSQLWSFSLLYVLATFSIGGVEPILQSMVSMQTPYRRRGLIFGFQTLVASFGWFLAPIVSSRISISFSIKHTFLSYSLALFVGFLSVNLLRSGLKAKREEGIE